METSTCQVPRNVLLVVVVWCLRCNNQKGVRAKKMKAELMILLELVIGKLNLKKNLNAPRPSEHPPVRGKHYHTTT